MIAPPLFEAVVAGRPQQHPSQQQEGRTALSTTLTQKAVQQKFEQVTSPEQAHTQITILPAVMAYEAKYAIQHLRENTDPQLFAEIVEPLARAVGWAEGLAYVFGQQAGSVGAQVPTGNGSRLRS